MAKGLNKAMIIGRLGQDPEIRHMPSGDQACNLSVATDESYKDKSGQKVDKTEWHRVSMFGKLAEIAGQYLTKGAQVYIEGKLETRKWQAQDGSDRFTTEIKAFQMQMLGGGQQGSAQPARQEKPVQGGRGKPDGQMPEPVTDFDDDMPF